MFQPGRVLTAYELKDIFNFETMRGVNYLLDFIENDFTGTWMRVDTFEDERMLIFERDCWEAFVVFMQTMGHTYSE